MYVKSLTRVVVVVQMDSKKGTVIHALFESACSEITRFPYKSQTIPETDSSPIEQTKYYQTSCSQITERALILPYSGVFQVDYRCDDGTKFADGRDERTLVCNEFGEFSTRDVSCLSKCFIVARSAWQWAIPENRGKQKMEIQFFPSKTCIVNEF